MANCLVPTAQFSGPLSPSFLINCHRNLCYFLKGTPSRVLFSFWLFFLYIFKQPLRFEFSVWSPCKWHSPKNLSLELGQKIVLNDWHYRHQVQLSHIVGTFMVKAFLKIFYNCKGRAHIVPTIFAPSLLTLSTIRSPASLTWSTIRSPAIDVVYHSIVGIINFGG